MEKKNNIIIMILMGLIIVILAILCILFATNTIKFNHKVDNNSSKKDIIDKKEESKVNNDETSGDLEKTSVIGTYQGIFEYAEGTYTIYEFELLPNNIVRYVIASSHNNDYSDATITMNYNGTYLEKENKIILSIISKNECDYTGKYLCKDIINLVKDSNNSFTDENDSTLKFNKVNSKLLID